MATRSLSRLPDRLRRAAIAFSQLTGPQAGDVSVLVGGAAVMVLGAGDRDTKDLDFNLLLMSNELMARLNQGGISMRTTDAAAGRFRANVGSSSPGANDATKIDLAVKPDILSLMEYTYVLDNVRLADHRLLLVNKIQCYSERGEAHDQKIFNDYRDIETCLNSMGEKEKMPTSLVDMISPVVWENFWRRANEREGEDRAALLHDMFEEVGLVERTIGVVFELSVPVISVENNRTTTAIPLLRSTTKASRA